MKLPPRFFSPNNCLWFKGYIIRYITENKTVIVFEIEWTLLWTSKSQLEFLVLLCGYILNLNTIKTTHCPCLWLDSGVMLPSFLFSSSDCTDALTCISCKWIWNVHHRLAWLYFKQVCRLLLMSQHIGIVFIKNILYINGTVCKWYGSFSQICMETCLSRLIRVVIWMWPYQTLSESVKQIPMFMG